MTVGCEKPYIDGPDTDVCFLLRKECFSLDFWMSWITCSQQPDDVWQMYSFEQSDMSIMRYWNSPLALSSVRASYQDFWVGVVVEK
jgi:hypothetical protein